MITEVKSRTRNNGGKRSSLETLEWLLFGKFGRDERLDSAREQYRIAEQAAGEHEMCLESGDMEGANEHFGSRRQAESCAWNLFNQVQAGDNIAAAARLLGKVPEGYAERKALGEELTRLGVERDKKLETANCDNFVTFRQLKDDSFGLSQRLETIIQEIERKEAEEWARARFEDNVAGIERLLHLMPQLRSERVSIELQPHRKDPRRTIYFFRVNRGSRTVGKVLGAIRAKVVEDTIETADAAFGLLKALEYRTGTGSNGHDDGDDGDQADRKARAGDRDARAEAPQQARPRPQDPRRHERLRKRRRAQEEVTTLIRPYLAQLARRTWKESCASSA